MSAVVGMAVGKVVFGVSFGVILGGFSVWNLGGWGKMG